MRKRVMLTLMLCFALYASSALAGGYGKPTPTPSPSSADDSHAVDKPHASGHASLSLYLTCPEWREDKEGFGTVFCPEGDCRIQPGGFNPVLTPGNVHPRRR